ncbi:MAG: aldehyde dehydrogenase family protein, partial [Desulfobacterales bacterium]|nr:aldehyde dehydrogenase family protein [Desulfobacterales bacterium]
FVSKKDDIAQELTRQMGRPIRYTPLEVKGFEERARYMISIARASLADIMIEPKAGFTRYIRKEPLKVVFVIAPWNYPYLTAVNSIIPALLAGNTVILKHSSQTPLCAERIMQACNEAGFPKGIFQFLHLSHADTSRVIEDERVNFVSFTGSVSGGHSIQKSASQRFIGTGLELGGKDPAYVRHDVNIEHAIENLTDGAFFNSGQSCCGIERIYVHEKVYDHFVEGVVEIVKKYHLDNPLNKETTLGPMVRTAAADFVRDQIHEALQKGAKTLIDPKSFPADKKGTPYLAPQVMVNVNHSMRIMTEESFGPVVGIMKVKGDEEAIALMNDSEYGLTASVWTTDTQAAISIGERVDTGTWFMNRCDYLDPALAWTGIKHSGRGCTLSRVGYEHLTRPKSFHLRTTLT